MFKTASVLLVCYLGFAAIYCIRPRYLAVMVVSFIWRSPSALFSVCPEES